MGGMSQADFIKAAVKLDRGQEAQQLINEAGKGLMDVFKAAGTNTVTLATIAKLHVVQGFIGEAAILLLESVSLMKDEPKEAALEIPGGD